MYLTLGGLSEAELIETEEAMGQRQMLVRVCEGE
jgi:hypothetical protein